MRVSDPAAALASLDQALQFLGARNERQLLPDIYLQRGRTHARMGDDAAALADFDNGIRELHTLRAEFSQGQLRSEFYDTKSDLFTDTIALLLRRGDTARAFTVADDVRARTLTEQLDPGAPADQTVTLTALAQRLSPDGAVVEYALLNDSVAIFYASRSTTGVEIVPQNTDELRNAVERFDDDLQRRRDIAVLQRQAAALHRMLIAPVMARLRGIDHLTVIPDRELHALPFASLYDGDSHRYLVEDFTVAIAPSARYLFRPASPLSLTPALVVGDPSDSGPTLPDAAREAQAIASMYPATTFLTGDRATRGRFIESAERSGMIHYAGHAQTDGIGSSETVRLAADDGRSSGDLDADDIAKLRLRRSPLVVLAACGTIRGDASHVEGMASIARAFLAAGAHDVIGTLWEIDDNTAAALFRRVHQHLRDGATPAAALRDAQLALLRSGDAQLQHPASWAPIEILGRQN
jgi:CHAT domain-containing protein